jgi:hypothetical protein
MFRNIHIQTIGIVLLERTYFQNPPLNTVLINRVYFLLALFSSIAVVYVFILISHSETCTNLTDLISGFSNIAKVDVSCHVA